MYKRFLILLFINILVAISASASPQDIVSLFGQYINSWCTTGDISYRSKIEQLCTGKKSCRVEDKIHADYQRKRGYMDYETYVLDSYLNMFETLMSSGVRFNLSNIKVETQDRYPDGQVLTFITADVKVSGKINYSVKDLFLVRDNQISGIYTYSSKYGFQHLNGSLIAELQRGRYTKTDGFQRGFAIVYKDGKEALIDRKGIVIIPLVESRINRDYESKFASIHFKDEFAGVLLEDKDVYYDLRNGGKIIPIQYFWTPMEQWTSEGMALVAKGSDRLSAKIGYLRENDLTYQDVIYKYDHAEHFKYGMALVEVDGKSMIIDKKFRIILRENDLYEFSNPFAFAPNLVIIHNKKNDLYGVANVNGEIVIPCKYDDIRQSCDGYACATYNGKSGLINLKGDVIAPFRYDFASDHGNGPHGLFKVVKYIGERRQEGFINTQGVLIIPFSDTDYTSNTFDDVIIEGKKYVYIGANRVINGVRYETIIDRYGNIYPGFDWKYNYIGIFDESGLACFGSNGKYGFLNIKGEVIIPAKYDDSCWFEKGYACVSRRINGKLRYGAIDTNGTLIIPCVYDNDFQFDNGIALVEKDNKLGLIDVYGNSYFFE